VWGFLLALPKNEQLQAGHFLLKFVINIHHALALLAKNVLLREPSPFGGQYFKEGK